LDAKRQTRDQAMNNQTMTLAMMDVLGETAAAEDLKKCKTLLSTEEAIPLLVLNSIVAIIAIYVHLLVLQMLKREQFCFSNELRLYIYINIICIPLSVVFNNGIINFMYPAAEVIGIEYCHVTITFLAWNFQRFIVHSLVMALFKYIFTVHVESVAQFGESKVRMIISSISWIFPTLTAALHMTVKKEPDPIFWLNLCYGYDEHTSNGDQVEDNFWNRAKGYMCASDDYGLNTRFGRVTSETATILQILCFISLFVGSIVLSNIPEGFLYYKLAKHINR